MNIIIIHSHDTGRCIAPYGYPVHTPALSALARQGILFGKAFSAAPTCSPSRAAMLTGRYPHEVAMTGLAHRGFSLDPVDEHLSWKLRGLGYRTILAGVQHEVPHHELLGYETYLGDDPEAMFGDSFDSKQWDTRCADALCAWAHRESDTTGPFFLFWGLFNPHRPYELTERSDARPPWGTPDTPETRCDTTAMHDAIEFADAQIGRVLDTFEQQGLLDDTAVCYTTDHGIAFPEHKCTLTDRGIGVSLILRLPDGAGQEQGRVCDAVVTHRDLYHTVLEMAGAAGHPDDTLSLLSDQEPGDRPVFSEISYHAAYQPCRAVRTAGYNLIRTFYEVPFVPANIDDSVSKYALIGRQDADSLWDHRCPGAEDAHGFPRLQSWKDHFYDLQADPDESQDLSGSADPQILQSIEAHRRLLEQWMIRTDDPLRNGVVPAPEQAQVNRFDAYSPAGPLVETDILYTRTRT
jgi:N-sulfoglucosamine sulfohydrolase